MRGLRASLDGSLGRALGAAFAAGALAFTAPALAQDFTASELPGGLILVSGPDGNVVAAEGADGLILIGGASQENAQALLDFVLAETGAARVAAVVNTGWRPDITGSNAVMAGQGASILAHANTHQWLKYGTENRADGVVYEPQPEAALPDHVLYDDGGTLPFGAGEIRIGYLLQANTDSDLYAYFPEADVLVTGPAVRSDGWQMLDWWTGGYMGGLLDGYGALLRVAGENTTIIPASGPAIDRDRLQAQFTMYTELYDRIGTSLKAAQSPAETVAARPTEGFYPEWEDADRFAELAHRSYYAHLRGNRRLGSIP